MRPSSRTMIAAVAVLASALATDGSAWAYPKPASVPYRWELQFQPGELRLYRDAESGASFWYLPYKVTNRTGRQQVWAPGFVLYTDRGEILHSGRDVPTRVSDDLIALLGNPLLETQNQIIGEMWVNRTSLASYTYTGGGTPPAVAATWVARVGSTLPGTAANQPTIDVSGNTVTVTVYWQHPEEAKLSPPPPPHNLKVIASIDCC